MSKEKGGRKHENGFNAFRLDLCRPRMGIDFYGHFVLFLESIEGAV